MSVLEIVLLIMGIVIFIGSFSKILCPGIRTGWMVAAPEITDKLIQLKMAADTQK